MPTDFAALDALYPLPPAELFRQWVLTADPRLVPPPWQQRQRYGWCLGTHPDAHVCELQASDGRPLGWALEPLAYLTHAGDSLPKQTLTLPVDAHADGRALEQALYGRDAAGRSDGTGLMGPWVAIVFGGPESAPFRRVYLSATHSVVYSPLRRAVATSHNLVPDLQRDEALSRAIDPLATRTPFMFGLTAFHGLHRLLPNHYLDLDSFEAVRHWPVDALAHREAGEAGAAAIMDHARRLIAAVTREYSAFRVFLSAGRDSRAVLAMLRPHVDKGGDVRLATAVGPDLGSQIDLQSSRRLARIAGLPHDITRRRPQQTPTGDARRAFVRIGEAMAGKSLAASEPAKPGPYDPAARFNLGGMGGETGRGFYWHRGLPDEAMTPSRLATQLKCPVTETVTAAARAWLEGLPPALRDRPADLLDLAYVEQRLGCWQAPQGYLAAGMTNPNGPSRLSTSPMLEAFAIETMLRLPQPYRAAGALQADMVAYGWPELLKVPFNTATGLLRLRDAKRSLRRLFQR